MLRELREARGFGLREFAREAGIAQSFLSRLEAGTHHASTATIAKIASVLYLSDSERQSLALVIGSKDARVAELKALLGECKSEIADYASSGNNLDKRVLGDLLARIEAALGEGGDEA